VRKKGEAPDKGLTRGVELSAR